MSFVDTYEKFFFEVFLMGALLIIIYMAFISLGLPDSLLGSAWPVMYKNLNVPMSWSGIIFMIVSFGTIVSSLNSDRLTKCFGSGKVTAVSVALTMIALLGNSLSHSFIELCFWAIPYGLGAGSVDAALNNYVALHYRSSHMNWLHCMWGIGASIGPFIMSWALKKNGNWHLGYRIISMVQLALTVILFVSLPKWKEKENKEEEKATHIPLKDVVKIKGVLEIMLAFFCYCSIEQTTGLWASGWLVKIKGIDEVRASAFAALYFTGITIGRALSGFLAYRFDDRKMIRLGETVILSGLVCILQPWNEDLVLYGLVILGLGSAPIFPSLIHSIPSLFGKDRSQSIIGVQMASAYAGNITTPPLLGYLARYTGLGLFPYCLLVLTVLLIFLHERLCAITKEK